MSDPDRSLLARLNALKSTSVSLDNNHKPSAPAPASPTDDAPSAPSDLSARFARLGGHRPNSTGAETHAAAAADDDDDTTTTTPHNPEDDETLNELLAELGARDETWHLDPSSERDIHALVGEARKLIDTTAAASASASAETGGIVADDAGAEGGEQRTDAAGDDADEQREADEIVARLLAQLDLEEGEHPATPPPAPAPEAEGAAGEDGDARKRVDATPVAVRDVAAGGLDLPSTPDTELRSRPGGDESSGEADLSARSSGLSLPSAPSFAPAQRKSGQDSKPQHSDEDIETWCVICTDDATVICRGCDNDKYCRQCWKEGHMGPDAGYEEKTHKWASYVPKKG